MALSLEQLDSQTLLTEFARSKGVATFDDDDEAEPKRELEQHHQLHVHIEHCSATRPSHHLRGSKQKYVDYADSLENAVRALQGEGELVIMANQPEWANLPQLQPHNVPKYRPGSAGSVASQRAPLQPRVPDSYGFPNPTSVRWPRVGSFEASYALSNTTTGTTYGPYPAFSKLQSGRWPRDSSVVSRIEQHLQILLKQDAQNFAFEKKTAAAAYFSSSGAGAAGVAAATPERGTPGVMHTAGRPTAAGEGAAPAQEAEVTGAEAPDNNATADADAATAAPATAEPTAADASSASAAPSAAKPTPTTEPTAPHYRAHSTQ